MYIIIPVIIITIIVALSFGASNFRNISTENVTTDSIAENFFGFFNLTAPWLQKEGQQNSTQPVLQEP